jgi:1-acyl-sn-glycerol-3-phosphate acyltransferase
MDRSRTVSVLVGLGAAVVMGLVGPLYGSLVVICATPLIFLTLSRALTGRTIDPTWTWVLIAFGAGWFALLPVAPFIQGSISNIPENASSIWVASAVIGLVPVLVAAGLVALARYRASRAA